MTVINTNTASINAQYNLNKVNKEMESAMEALSSGKRINSAADDAAGLSIATRMESQVRGLMQSINNAQDGISLVQSVEGALQESTNIMQRMYELSVQATNSTYTDTDREALQSEIAQLQTELDRISSDTEFNGQKVLDGSFSGKSLSVGFTSEGTISLDIADHSSAALSAEGTKDAVANLLSSVSNIALGANTQAATTSTAQMAVVKADTQTATITQSQFNIGQDATQAISSTTVARNVAIATSVETFTTKEVGTAAVATITQGTGGTAVYAVTVTGAAGVAQQETITVGGSGFQIGAVLSAEDGSANESVYTIRAEDIKTTDALTRESIAANWTAQITADSELGDYSSATVSGAIITLTHGTPGVVAQAIQVGQTNASTTAATGVETLTFSGDFDEGDIITVYGRSGTQKENSISYTVTEADAALGTAALRQAAVATGITAAINGTTTGDFEGVTGGGTDAVALNSVVTITNTVVNSGDSAWRVQIDSADGRQAASVAGARDTQIAYVDSANSNAGVDGVVDARSFKVDGQMKFGDQISVTVNATGAAVAYTVDADDLATDATVTKTNAIDSFVSAFNNSDPVDRFDDTGGLLTASREGNDTIVFTASVASATDIAFNTALAVTDRTAGALGITSTQTAATGAVAATDVVTFDSGANLEEGDVISMATSGSLGSAIEYTVTRDDIGEDDETTLENVRSSLIAAFNAADAVDRTDPDSGLITASANSTDGAITFTGTTTTAAAGHTVTITETNSTATIADGSALQLTEVTQATNSAGSATGTYVDDNRVATASTKMVKFDTANSNVEVGDIIELTVGDITVSHTVQENEATAEFVAAALADLVNDIDGQGTTISTAASGVITASASNGELTLTSAETGSSSDFEVSTNTVNNTATAQVSSVELNGVAALEEGDVVRLALTDENYVEVTVTKDMVDLGEAGSREAVRDALVALTNGLENVTLSADADDTDKIIIASDVPGVAFTATMTETQGTGARQQDLLSISGTVGRGDVFTVNVGGQTASFTVDEATAGLRTNAERITAVRDGLIEEIKSTTAVDALLSSAVADGNDGILLTALTAGTAIVTSNSSTTNNTAIASQTQIDNVALSGDAEEGDVFSISLDNGSSISYTVTAEDAAGVTADDRLNAARDGLISAAASGLTGVTASASDNVGEVVLTSTQVGVGFETSVSTSNASDVAQIENVAFANVEAGDSFSVTIGDETASYTAVEGDDAAAVAAWMAGNASFAGKSLAVADGQLSVTGAAGESFAVTTATSNFAGGVQSDVIALSGTVETNDVYSVDIDGTKVSYSVQDADVSMDTVVANLAAAINASGASASVTASVNDDGNLALTSTAAGVGYTASVEVSDVGRSRNSVAAIDISTESGATAALEVLVGAMEQVGETRSSLGAIQNRLDYTINNLSNVIVNTESAQSQIEDADFAKVTGELTKAQIMSQAATAMLAQANASKQGVLSLLQG